MEKGKRRFYGRVEFSSVAISQDKKLPYIHDEVSSKGDLSGFDELKSTSSFPPIEPMN